MLSARDIREFRGFLRNATDRQVQGIYDKEKRAGRDDYAELAVAEAERRGIELDEIGHSTKKSPASLDREIAKALANGSRPRSTRSTRSTRSHATVGGTRSLVDVISAGCRVTIVDRFGKQRTGRAVMRGPYGWVLNLGGRHGTPGIANTENIVSVRCKG